MKNGMQLMRSTATNEKTREGSQSEREGGGRGVVSSSFFVFELKPRARESDKEFDRIEAEEAPWLLKSVALSAYRKRNLRGVLSEPPLKKEKNE